MSKYDSHRWIRPSTTSNACTHRVVQVRPVRLRAPLEASADDDLRAIDGHGCGLERQDLLRLVVQVQEPADRVRALPRTAVWERAVGGIRHDGVVGEERDDRRDIVTVDRLVEPLDEGSRGRPPPHYPAACAAGQARSASVRRRCGSLESPRGRSASRSGRPQRDAHPRPTPTIAAGAHGYRPGTSGPRIAVSTAAPSHATSVNIASDQTSGHTASRPASHRPLATPIPCSCRQRVARPARTAPAHPVNRDPGVRSPPCPPVVMNMSPNKLAHRPDHCEQHGHRHRAGSGADGRRTGRRPRGDGRGSGVRGMRGRRPAGGPSRRTRAPDPRCGPRRRSARGRSRRSPAGRSIQRPRHGPRAGRRRCAWRGVSIASASSRVRSSAHRRSKARIASSHSVPDVSRVVDHLHSSRRAARS